MELVMPDGSVREFEDGAIPLDVADSISKSLKKEMICAQVDGNLWDKSKPLPAGKHTFRVITKKDPEAFAVLNHSCTHLMAQAICRLFPGTKLAYGPALPEGFYYDVRTPQPISEKDFPAIEKEMLKIASQSLPITREEISPEEAKEIFADQPYKTIHTNEVEDRDHCVSIYRQGEFVDLCRGPHMPNTGYCKHFKLLSLAGAYWKGDKNNDQLTRVYGCCYFTAEELKEHLDLLEERKQADHRRLGKELNIFSLSEYGPGMPFWLDGGWAVKRSLENYILKILRKHRYQMIQTPQILSRKLWETSGHWDHYKDNMFTTQIEDEVYAVKPMNCPGAMIVYNQTLHSYRDLPVRIAEYGADHRYEASGALNGLLRLREFTQDDAHIILELFQVQSEVEDLIGIFKEVYSTFGLSFSVELSTMPADHIGTEDVWRKAERELQEVMEKTGIRYVINEGDGAFYGPKLDFKVLDSMKREWQCGTIQLDMQLPGRFGCVYVGRDGTKKTPVMIHRAILGSFDRFIGVLTEHFKGAFPTWCAPYQVALMPVMPEDEAQRQRVEKLRNELIDKGYRVTVFDQDEKVNYRIRLAQVQKIPYTLVVGKSEVADGTDTFRIFGRPAQTTVPHSEFLKILSHDVDGKFLTPAEAIDSWNEEK